MKKRLETLTCAHGVSGDESAIRAAIRQAAEPYADDITEDALGNLIVHQKGAGKKIMLAAHMDSVGVIVTHIEQNGFLRFGAIGGLEAKALYQTMVRFQNGTVGVIAVEESKEEKEFKLTDLYIDIGARDREEAKTMVMVGDTAAFSGALSGNGNRVMGPYLTIGRAVQCCWRPCSRPSTRPTTSITSLPPRKKWGCVGRSLPLGRWIRNMLWRWT